MSIKWRKPVDGEQRSECDKFSIERYSNPADGTAYFCYIRNEGGKQKFNFIGSKYTPEEARQLCEAKA
jgi:hypothetical protein